MAFWPILMKLGNILFQYFKSLLHNLTDQFSARTGDVKSRIHIDHRSVQLLLLKNPFLLSKLGYTNEVDSGIQMYRWSVQLLTFNILVLL